MKYRSLTLLIFSAAILFFSCKEKKEETPKEPPRTINEFGIVVDSLTEIRDEVKPNQTITEILAPYAPTNFQIQSIIQAGKDTFDVKKIIPGNDYYIYLTDDSLTALRYFIYAKDKINYVIFDFRDSAEISLFQKEIVVKKRSAAGVINSSLFETMSSLNEDINLAMRLAEIFAWQIDFYAIQPGDNFKVIFDEEFVDGKQLRIGNIYAAYFSHKGENFYALQFNNSGAEEYFDENGKSLRKAFLKAPLKFSRISSRFSNSRFHPILKRYRPHHGIDYAAPVGTPVQAIGDGTVIEKRYSKSEGNYLKIRHNSNFQSGYMHLSNFAKGIKIGSFVRQGDLIGYVGSTGLSTGPHLDFRFWKLGRPVNFLNENFPSSHPVSEDKIAAFDSLKIPLMMELDGIRIAVQPDSSAVKQQ